MKPDQTRAVNLLTAEQEEQLLVHFRQHSHAAPSAQIDAQILMAASASASVARSPQAPRQSLWARCWELLRRAKTSGWSVAVAGLACVGLALNLSWMGADMQPPGIQASAAMSGLAASASAPIARSAAPVQAEVQAAIAAPLTPAPSSAAYAARSNVVGRSAKQVEAPAVASAEQSLRDASSGAEALADPADDELLLTQLKQLLELRHNGATPEANKLLAKIKDEYPTIDVEARLTQLQPQP